MRNEMQCFGGCKAPQWEGLGEADPLRCDTANEISKQKLLGLRLRCLIKYILQPRGVQPCVCDHCEAVLRLSCLHA
jgi:hypothetical protein